MVVQGLLGVPEVWGAGPGSGGPGCRARHGANCRDAELKPVSSRWALELMEGPLQCVFLHEKEHFLKPLQFGQFLWLTSEMSAAQLQCSRVTCTGESFCPIEFCFSVKETSILQEAFDI